MNICRRIAVSLALIAMLSWPGVAGARQEAAQESAAPQGYQFTDVHRVECTPVKSQDQTGTCWCFATASFMESEAMRMGKGIHNLSEMFVVRNTYLDKVRNFILRQGKTNFGEGAMSHDLLMAVSQHGIAPEEIYSGLLDGVPRHNHSELSAVLQGVAETYAKQRAPSSRWDEVVTAVLNVYLGKAPEEFSYQGKTYTPRSFAESIGFDAANYVGITSYTHHPFGQPFTLECPDNYSGGQFQNVPIDDLVALIDRSLAAGYSVAWDGDVSERGFVTNHGIAVLPADPQAEFAQGPQPEQPVTQEMRQETFENFSTGEEHLMHLVGVAKDQNGTKYYVIKNSWGEIGDHQGYLYMSENYVRLKTVAITVHRDILAQPANEDASKASTSAPASQPSASTAGSGS